MMLCISARRHFGEEDFADRLELDDGGDHRDLLFPGTDARDQNEGRDAVSDGLDTGFDTKAPKILREKSSRSSRD
jgi:hypothetical protein